MRALTEYCDDTEVFHLLKHMAIVCPLIPTMSHEVIPFRGGEIEAERIESLILKVAQCFLRDGTFLLTFVGSTQQLLRRNSIPGERSCDLLVQSHRKSQS